MTAWIRLGLAVALVAMTSAPLRAQTQEGVDILLSKARSLETRGRMDLAAQNWSQVLLVDPNQAEALEGLARNAKQNGDADALRTYLDRLRAINPKHPAIDAVEKMHVLTPKELRLLDDAGRLAAQHKPDEAMAIYRGVFGDAPPAGKWADAYYETEASSAGGREKAIAQLRDRTSRDPANEVYRFWLARVLTYDPKTRMEGLRLLESIRDPGAVDQARAAWRQALAWEKDNAAAQASLEAYLRRYPDPELQDRLNEQHGFQALRDKNLTAAQARFEDVVRRAPNDTNALVGLGFVRLSQKKFDLALALFSRARALAPGRADAKDGYDTAAFWIAMQRGASLQANQPDAALAAYQEAAALRPDSEQPLLAIAQIMQRRGNLAEAQARFEQVLKTSPNSVDALVGMGFVRLTQKDFDAAGRLFARAQALAPGRSEIEAGYRSAKLWALMQQAGDAMARDQIGAAIARYNEALAIDAGAKDALVGLAEATRRKGNRAETLDAYRRLAAAYPADVRGWLGLIRSQIESNDPQAALETVASIPDATRRQLDAQPDYLARVAQASYSANRSAAGDQALGRALAAAMRSDSDEALNVRLEIASFLMNQGKDAGAVSIYRQAVGAHPDHATAWQGLIAAYTHLHDSPKALAAVRSMPPRAYDVAAGSQGFLNLVASVYAAEGFCGEAEGLLTRSMDLDKAAGHRPAAATQLQLADVWTREGRHDRASRAYREALTADNQSVSGWQGYITALHNERQEYSALAEIQRMPPAVQTTLMSDANFLRLVSGIQSAVGGNAKAVELLQDARARSRTRGQLPPADLDVQLAWTMLGAPKYLDEVPAFLQETRARTDLRQEQRDALDEISATYSIRIAEAAMVVQDPSRALAVLSAARSDLPNDAGIRSALASVYLRQHEFDRALDVYRSWDMKGATAGDYRAAAGTALAARRTIVAEKFLWDGRQHWPNDPELLHMTALQSLSHEDYDSAEQYLASALTASRREQAGSAQKASVSTQAVSAGGPMEGTSCRDVTGSARAGLVASATAAGRQPGERQNGSITTEQLEDELDAVRNRNAPFVALASPVSMRLGDPGLNRLYVVDRVTSGSVAVGDFVRVGLDAHFLQLDSGTPNGLSGYRFGSLAMGEMFAGQHARGWAGVAQVSGTDFGGAFGLLPAEFPVQNWTAGLRVGSPDGMFRLIVARDAVKDSLLSYAGTRDPVTRIVWGGVVANSGTVEFSRYEARNGQYASVGGSLLRGFNVADNWSAQATAGAYWRVVPSAYGGLSVGVNATAMHYDRNLNFFSMGHGGYFSPQRYLLGAVPVSWFERRNRLEYEIVASGGVQRIEQDGAPLDPTRDDPADLFYNPDRRRGANYNLQFRLDYTVASRLSVETFAGANNARDFASRTFGITLTWFLSRVPAGTHLPLKTLPDWRGVRSIRFD